VLLRLEQGFARLFGSRPLLDHVDLQVGEGERVCLIGRNGEGKSSLLRLVAGRAPSPTTARCGPSPARALR
jgi:ATP-binding cassette subfamily F protein uup